ncbi:hypothetical protein BJV78DRAFT_1180971 [Lactifluus subvellereus]|nr:hypothetical protein BJV78DRAFT_1180971 [Lactifluus subvellereus]
MRQLHHQHYHLVMATSLRRVTRNYNWTVKRAHNDLHESISPQPSPAPISSPPTDIPIDPLDVSSNRLQLKFKSEYEELREHFEHAYVILASWLVIVDQLLRVAASYFISHPIRSVTSLYERCSKLATLGILPISIGSLLVVVFQYATRLMDFLPRDIHFKSYIDMRLAAGNQTEAKSLSPFEGRPSSPEVPVKSSHVLSSEQTPPKDNPIVTSDSTEPGMSSIDDLKGHIEGPHPVVHGGASILSYTPSPIDTKSRDHGKKVTGVNTGH